MARRYLGRRARHGRTSPPQEIIDDPHTVTQSLSEASRQEAITWFDLTMGSRGVALGAATIVHHAAAA
jgi:hypothetical protein